ncbi:ATP-binding protein [Streptomyces europaeiscabiei]|uniref:ATP-binding protein n=1 Tax=Streptomyces europaeiscabiei TaxID=146819 RepID=UPI0038F7108F
MNARDAVLPEHRIDDVTLLLARTHALVPQHVADRDVEPDPAQVPRARKFTLDQLEAWGLEEASFVTELVVGELVTNAIRYGEPPIRLRLDSRHLPDLRGLRRQQHRTPPTPGARLRRGRGLLLVAQLTQGWGPGTPPAARRSGAHRPHRARAAMRSDPGGPSPGSRQDGDGPRVS